jgi:hypothetical protein
LDLDFKRKSSPFNFNQAGFETTEENRKAAKKPTTLMKKN